MLGKPCDVQKKLTRCNTEATLKVRIDIRDITPAGRAWNTWANGQYRPATMPTATSTRPTPFSASRRTTLVQFERTPTHEKFASFRQGFVPECGPKPPQDRSAVRPRPYSCALGTRATSIRLSSCASRFHSPAVALEFCSSTAVPGA